MSSTSLILKPVFQVMVGVEQRRVAQIVRLHDAGVERGEVERRDGLVVEALYRVDHRGALVAHLTVVVAAATTAAAATSASRCS